MRIAESAFIDNSFTNLIKLNGFLLIIINSFFINTASIQKSVILSSDNIINILNSQIYSIKGIVFQIPNTFEEI